MGARIAQWSTRQSRSPVPFSPGRHREPLAEQHSFASVAHFVFLRDVWIRTQRAAVTSRRATNLATHLFISSKNHLA
jgi:hypothetical protein